MKAILEFNFPDDDEDYRRANAASDLCSFIFSFESYLRGQLKYADIPDDIDKISETWFDLLNKNNIDLEKIYT